MRILHTSGWHLERTLEVTGCHQSICACLAGSASYRITPQAVAKLSNRRMNFSGIIVPQYSLASVFSMDHYRVKNGLID